MHGAQGTWTVGGVSKTVEGTWGWSDTSLVPAVGNTGYNAVFTPADSSNYETAIKTVTVEVTKAAPYIATVPALGTITYGERVSDATIGTDGVVQYSSSDTTPVSGSFIWKATDAVKKPTVADSGVTIYTLVFKPGDTTNYKEVTTEVKITINKAQNAPNMSGSTISAAFSQKKVSDITLPDGWNFDSADAKKGLKVNEAVTVTAVYTGADKGNYENETVQITITRSACKHETTEIRNKKDADCTQEGYTGDTYCIICQELVHAGTVIQKSAHSGGTATCCHGAYCEHCGTEYTEKDASNHEGGTDIRNKKEATCVSDGYTGDSYCKGCGARIKAGSVITATRHIWDKGEVSEIDTDGNTDLEFTHASEYTAVVDKEPVDESIAEETDTESPEEDTTETSAQAKENAWNPIWIIVIGMIILIAGFGIFLVIKRKRGEQKD